MIKTTLALVPALLLISAPANSASFTLYNTGVDSAGGVLANDAVDPHYVLVNPPPVFSAAAYAKVDGPIASFGWVGTNATSRWIVPSPNFAFGDQPGITDRLTYRTTFSLGGLAPTTARITGRVAADDSLLGIFLNGVAFSPSQVARNDVWSDFFIDSGFIAGSNRLEFVTESTLNPTGLRVEMTGTAAVPEPASWAMLIAGFGLVGAAARRRRTVIAA
jgi:hypothetical protein